MQIVQEVLVDHSLVKEAVAALEACAPDPLAARALLEAHDTGGAPSWLVACLLGRLSHPSGYGRVLEILRRGDGHASEDYAAASAVRLAGPDCQADLEAIIDTVEAGPVRKAAAWALGSLGTPRAIAYLVGALARRRLRALTVARALSPVHVDVETMLDALRSTDHETRRWPPMMIAERVRLGGRAGRAHARELRRCAQSSALRDALSAVLDDEDLVWRADAEPILRWLETPMD